MFKKLFLSLILLISATMSAQELVGEWSGVLSVQGFQLKLIFKVEKTDKGYNTTMDVPAQKVKGMKVSKTNFNAPSVRFELNEMFIDYSGQLTGNQIVGTFKQQGQEFPLTLLRSCSKNPNAKTQTYRIKGFVTDSMGQPVAYPTISIKADSTTLDYSERHSGDGDGKFDLTTKQTQGSILVNISAAYKASVSKSVVLTESISVDMGKIILNDGEDLEAVSVVAYKPLVTQDIDRIKYDIESDPESKLNSTLEMLRKVPLVTIDQDENIKIKGSSNFKIYLNGKPSNMISKNPKDVLKSMPASSIKRIEVITDPGAKYDAEGVTAILNIITQSSLQGYQGSVNAGISTRGNINGGTYMTSKIGKLGITANYGYGQFKSPMESTELYENKTQTAVYKGYTNIGNGNNKGHYNYGHFDISYELDSLNLLSSSFGLKGGKGTNASNILSQYRDYSDNIMSSHTNNILFTQKNYNISGSINYQKTFLKPDQLLTISYNLDMSPMSMDGTTKIVVDNTQPNTLGTNNSNMKNLKYGNTSEHSFQIDYTEPFKDKKHTIESGLKYIMRYNKADNGYLSYNETTKQYEKDNTRKENDMKYYQHIFSAYGSYAYKIKKLSFRLGGRVEGTYQDVRFIENPTQNFKVPYFDIVPSVSVNFKPNYSSNISLSYNNSISRPSIYYLNPYIDDSNPYRIKYGNPNLEAERSHNITLNYGYFGQKININISPSINIVNNSIETIRKINGKKIEETFDNIGKARTFGVNFYINYNPLSWLNMWVQGNNSYTQYKNADYEETGISFNGFAGMFFKMPWKLKANCYAGGGLPQVRYKSISGRWSYYSLGLSRSFLKDDKLTVGISATTPFNRYLEYRYKNWEDNVYHIDGTYKYQQREISIRISWNFGEMKAKIKKIKRGIKNDDLKSGGNNQQQGGSNRIQN